MQEIFFTLLVIWLLFRIFGNNTVRHVFTMNMNKPKEEKSGREIKVDYIPPKNKLNTEEGEYVDYEDLPANK